MWGGMPIMPLVGLFLSALVFGVITAIAISALWGLAVATPFLSALAALRFFCEKDYNYPRRIWFGFKRLLMNRKFGKELLLTPHNPNWSSIYGKRYAQQRYATGKISTDNAISRRASHGDVNR